MSKIYTKKGDKGMTGTFFGRVGKGELLPEVLGTIDELNSWVGMCRSGERLDSELKKIQGNLLTIGSQLAGSKRRLENKETKRLERLIDKLTNEMPKLSNFIYPIGQLQLARAICRRAERRIVELGTADKNILKYINRLSDALFTLARWVNFRKGIKEEVWK